jgi:protein-tyrosine-phosphatase
MTADLLLAPARGLRHAPDRLLHRLRRRAAKRVLRARPWPRAILVVCHGNICRSPFAAALLSRALAPVGTLVTSAGFVGPGRPAPAEGSTAAARRGIDLSAHRSQLLTPVLAAEADLIVVMDMRQQRMVCERFGRVPSEVMLLGDLDPEAIDTRAIHDPIDQPLEAFEQSYRRIERCVEALVAALGARAGARSGPRITQHTSGHSLQLRGSE